MPSLLPKPLQMYRKHITNQKERETATRKWHELIYTQGIAKDIRPLVKISY